MAELAIFAAINFFDHIVSHVNLGSTHYDVNATIRLLKTMKAYLNDTEGREATEGLKDRVQLVRDVAYEIEDAIEEFMLDVPEHFHGHRITRLLHDAAHSLTDRLPFRRLTSRMVTIQGLVEDIKETDTFRVIHHDQKASSSRGALQQDNVFGGTENLSPNLRYCFFYFCNFPANYSVRRGRLFRLWIAERFIEDTRNKTKEEVADEYLNKLIERNLVYVHGRDVEGRVESCNVRQDKLDSILDESEMTRFCTVLPRPNNTSPVEKSRRLSLHSYSTNSLRSKDLSSVRTLITFERDTKLVAEELLNNFKLLRVLDFENSGLNCFPKEVVKLTLLRYLSLRNTNINTIPRCIKKLHSLETLDLRQTGVKMLPKKILKLQNLLYLLVDQRLGNIKARQGVQLPSGIECLKSLRKLSLLQANMKNRRIIRELGNLVELRKLGITQLEKEDEMDLWRSIQNMKNLSSLSITLAKDQEGFLDLNNLSDQPPPLRRLSLGGRLLEIPRWISSLQSLARICLKGSKLEKSPLEALQVLPCLVELMLVDAYNGEGLIIKPNCFLELKVLHLEHSDGLQKVSVKSSKVLPKLEKLVLRGFETQGLPSRLKMLID